jgi:hypothetical protein
MFFNWLAIQHSKNLQEEAEKRFEEDENERAAVRGKHNIEFDERMLITYCCKKYYSD